MAISKDRKEQENKAQSCACLDGRDFSISSSQIFKAKMFFREYSGSN